jgi:hypothetical protein
MLALSLIAGRASRLGSTRRPLEIEQAAVNPGGCKEIGYHKHFSE